ncbi:MAG: Gfo/Idh/MocA family oxidoreductase [Actinomycetota bacterium]
MSTSPVRVGIFGTSWWADTIYLPGLDAHEQAEVVACCGRNQSRAETFARQWNIDGVYTEPAAMLAAAELDAVIVATANDTHHPLAIAAINAGLHVLCEKPLGLDVTEAEEMAAAAEAAGVITMVPFTYRYMPMNRWVRELVGNGYVGRPLHINARYYTSFGFETDYSWRFDREIAGSGIIGDLASHWIDLARWLLDDTEIEVSAISRNFVGRDSRPDGSAYEQMEDSAVLNVSYGSGAYGVLQTSAVCHEGTPFGQTHHLEIHGHRGTIYATCDWDRVQRVDGLRRGDTNGRQPLPIPEEIWGDVRRDVVHDTYRDVFRTTPAMTRGWIDAIAVGADPASVGPSFADGLAVQRVLDAAVASAADRGAPHPV